MCGGWEVLSEIQSVNSSFNSLSTFNFVMMVRYYIVLKIYVIVYIKYWRSIFAADLKFNEIGVKNNIKVKLIIVNNIYL